MEVDKKKFLGFIIESWRFSNLFSQIISNLDENEKKRFKSRLDWYRKQMEDTLRNYGYTLVDVSGEIYNTGMAINPLNIDEFDENDSLIVDYMMEPVVMSETGNIVKAGTAVLRRQEF